jgi:predicted RNase H-like HicB family nuclease
MKKITFQVTPCHETGGYVARWDDTNGGITTQGDTLEELNVMVTDAVRGYFALGKYKIRKRTGE